jgi:hypothetical protein
MWTTITVATTAGTKVTGTSISTTIGAGRIVTRVQVTTARSGSHGTCAA